METVKRKDFLQKLFSLVLPIAFQQFMLSLVSATDAVMLGQLSQDAMGAVSLAGQIQFVENLFLAAVTIGGSIFAAQYFGKGDLIMVGKVQALCLRLTLPVAALFTVVSAAFPGILMRILTNDKTLIFYGSEYLRAVSVSYLFCGISQIFLCILKNTGKAAMSSIVSSVSVVVNIGLNAVLIFGLLGVPALGVRGAALATVIARLLELLLSIPWSEKNGRVGFRLKSLTESDKTLSTRYWKKTLPVLGNELVWGLGFTMGSVILGHLGSDVVAANAIATVVRNLTSCLIIGIGSGGGILVGHELGAGELALAKEDGRQLCLAALFFGFLTGLFVLALTPAILRFADLTPDAAKYLRWMLLISTYYLVAQSLNTTTIAGIFCAGGDSRFGFLCDTVTWWCVVLPLGALSAFIFHAPLPITLVILFGDEVIKLPAVWKHYHKYQWVQNLTEEGETT